MAAAPLLESHRRHCYRHSRHHRCRHRLRHRRHLLRRRYHLRHLHHRYRLQSMTMAAGLEMVAMEEVVAPAVGLRECPVGTVAQVTAVGTAAAAMGTAAMASEMVEEVGDLANC